jgi:uncharacterized protein (DUF2252 family)
MAARRSTGTSATTDEPTGSTDPTGTVAPDATTAAFDAPIPAPTERRAAARALRKMVARSAHAAWEAGIDRPDPVELLVEQSRSRVPELVPLRFARMAQSPFAFLRGSALVMAHDLATTTDAGLEVRLCGDAHLANFGMFASPERRVVFDLNDFDEAFPGPFEWDVKRLAASLVVAARANGFDRLTARRAVLEAVAQYRDWTERYSAMTHLQVWYAKIDVRELLDTSAASAAAQRRAQRYLTKAEGKNHLTALSKLTVESEGRRRIVDDPPLVEHVASEAELVPRLTALLSQYRATLSADRQALFDRYRFVDFARKVVGVGSVGTRCWVALLQGPNGGPLFLQIKEANRSVIEQARGTTLAEHEGRRVVDGQRMLQATSDVLLGWATDEPTGHHYYLRQMWDAKGSIDVTALGPAAFGTYAGFCGWGLARAHARTGDSVSIHGYIGNSERFAEAIADFAEAYADQTERDHALLLAAIERGAITISI